MIIPKKIQIAGREVEIITDNEFCNKEGVIGQCRVNENKIYMTDEKNGASKQEVEQTLIHEILHYINGMLGRNGDIPDDHLYIKPLSELLYQVFNQIYKQKS